MDAPVALAAAAALTIGAAAAAAAPDATRIEPLWIDPAPPAGEAPVPACRLLGVVNLPPAWAYGDAAALRLSLRGAPADPLAERLTGALLDSGAAVLELATSGACGGEPADTPRRLRADLLGALGALHEDFGPGLVLAIGLGAAAGAAVLDAVGPWAAGPEAAPGPRFAAALALGGAAPAIRPGTPPGDRAQRWPMRAPLLCALIARVADAEGGTAPARLPTEAACLAALLPAAAPEGAAPDATPGRGRTWPAGRPQESGRTEGPCGAPVRPPP